MQISYESPIEAYVHKEGILIDVKKNADKYKNTVAKEIYESNLIIGKKCGESQNIGCNQNSLRIGQN